MHGPIRTFWADLTPFSRQPDAPEPLPADATPAEVIAALQAGVNATRGACGYAGDDAASMGARLCPGYTEDECKADFEGEGCLFDPDAGSEVRH
jgi:hypothetical protein